jgi:hypothetical protein
MGWKIGWVGVVLCLIGGSADADTRPAVVELFTSQGCSSCPPADKLLGELARRSDVLTLAYHVDYWNNLGWKDPFASADATRRQRRYAGALGLSGIYTPQMVVDGAIDAVGSDRRAVEAALAGQRGIRRRSFERCARRHHGGALGPGGRSRPDDRRCDHQDQVAAGWRPISTQENSLRMSKSIGTRFAPPMRDNGRATA